MFRHCCESNISVAFPPFVAHHAARGVLAFPCSAMLSSRQKFKYVINSRVVTICCQSSILFSSF